MIRVVCSETMIEMCRLETSGEQQTVFLVDHAEPSLSNFLKIMGEDLKSLPAGYDVVSDTIGASGLARMLIVPQGKIREHRRTILECLSGILDSTENLRYLNYYIKCRMFLDSLVPAKIDEKKLLKLIESQKHDGVRSNLSSFLPHEEYSAKIKYSMASSSTGRLSVTKGPKILTAPAEVKGVLTSRFDGGKVLQLDLCSAEPNFALFFDGKEPKADVYSDMCNQVLANSVDRKVAKLVTLSALYGQSTANLKKQLPNDIDASTVVNQVKKYLAYQNIFENLQSKMHNGDLRNYLGRPLVADKKRLLVSHFLQSSVAESAMIMFSDFCQKESRAIPIFVIHDALLIDCEKSLAEELLTKRTVSMPFENAHFPVSVSNLEEYL